MSKISQGNKGEEKVKKVLNSIKEKHIIFDEIDGEKYYMISELGKMVSAELYDTLDKLPHNYFSTNLPFENDDKIYPHDNNYEEKNEKFDHTTS